MSNLFDPRKGNISSKEPTKVCVDITNRERMEIFFDFTAEATLMEKHFLNTMKLSLWLALERSSNSSLSVSDGHTNSITRLVAGVFFLMCQLTNLEQR